MRHGEQNQKMEEHRKALLAVRGEILGKYNLEQEHRVQWLVKFMDIEDELEELSRRQSQLTNSLVIEKT